MHSILSDENVTRVADSAPGTPWAPYVCHTYAKEILRLRAVVQVLEEELAAANGLLGALEGGD